MRKLLALGAVVLSVVLVQACSRAEAKPKPRSVRDVAVTEMVGTVDTLKLRATWQASTVPGTPAGSITYPVTWVRRGATLRSVTKTGLADTLVVVRALQGSADTVTFNVRALYTVNGNLSNWSTLTTITLNPDLRFPAIPVIVTVDTL